jgi:hypothetical protein
LKKKRCEKCNAVIKILYGSGRFCSKHCAYSYASLYNREETNKKISAALKGKSTRGRISEAGFARLREGARLSQEKKKAAALLKPFKSMSLSMRREILFEDQGGKCAICNNPPLWMDAPLSLHYDHINGVNSDNRKVNSRLICPNCHSQTPSYCGRNRKQQQVIPEDKFVAAILAAGNIHKGLIGLGIAPKGGNYKRAALLLRKHGVTKKYGSVEK